MTRYFWPILTPCHTLSHIPGHPQRYVTHLGSPLIFSRPSTKTRTKTLCTNSLSIVRGVLSGGFVRGLLSGRFCPGSFLSVPSFSEYICYNRKLNMALNFRFHRFHMYNKK